MFALSLLQQPTGNTLLFCQFQGPVDSGGASCRSTRSETLSGQSTQMRMVKSLARGP